MLKKKEKIDYLLLQARTEGRKDPVVLQWDPWEGHLQVTDNIIVVVNLVVVIVFMVLSLMLSWEGHLQVNTIFIVIIIVAVFLLRRHCPRCRHLQMIIYLSRARFFPISAL